MYNFQSIYQARSVEDAICALARDPGAVVIAGGSDVLVQIREGKLAGCRLVSIHGLPQLAGVTMDNQETIHIGPLTTFREVTDAPLIREYLPFLGEATDQAGGPQLRAVGTIGGNLCNGMTSADSASTLVALNAMLTLQGPEGKRKVPISQWYQGVGRVARKPEELLVDIAVSRESYQGWSGHYIKYAQRNAMDIATLGVACLVKLSPDKTRCEQVRLAFGVAAPVPCRALTAEEGVAGLPVDQAVERVGLLALKDVNPRTSWRASREFRLQLVQELSGRALRQAIVNGGGELSC